MGDTTHSVVPSAPLRVCHLGKYYPPALGGIETNVRTLSRAQASAGLWTKVICINHQEGPTIREFDDGVEVVRVRSNSAIRNFHLSWELVREMQQTQADIFHMHVPNPTMILALLLADIRKPIVVTYHSDLVRQKLLGACFRPIEEHFYKRVSRILATTPNYVSGSRNLKQYRERVRVVPLGVELEPFFRPSLRQLEEAKSIRDRLDGPIWLSVGRLTYYKGLQVAVRALKRIEGTLVMVGEGQEKTHLQELVQQCGVENRVIFAGYQPDPIPFYLAADVFWFPSTHKSEAYGLAQIEAMACGLPVVNTQIAGSGVTFVSRHGETGISVPINSPLALADASSQLWRNRVLYRRFSQNAKDRSKRLFTQERMHELTLANYLQVVPDLVRGERAVAHAS